MKGERFSTPTKDILVLVQHIRDKYYKKFAEAKIITLMRNGKWSKYGTIHVVSEAQKKAGIQADYILTLSTDAWSWFNSTQKKALVDHELAHMVIKKGRKGIKWRCRHHDIEEFCSIAKRYGEWSPAIQRFKKALEEKG